MLGIGIIFFCFILLLIYYINRITIILKHKKKKKSWSKNHSCHNDCYESTLLVFITVVFNFARSRFTSIPNFLRATKNISIF